MALPTTPASSWLQSTGCPSRLFETGRNDFELYEGDDRFDLSVEMPGFDTDENTLAWDVVLDIAAEHGDETREQRKTYHRRFRFPKTVDDDGIEAQYLDGILEARLPVVDSTTTRGEEIEVVG